MALELIKSINNLIFDIKYKVEEFSHIEPEKIIVNFKKSITDTTYAEIKTISSEGDHLLKDKNGRIERFISSTPALSSGYPVKYLINLYIPLFFKLSLKEKLLTIFHELYHISPKFDGELRTFSCSQYQHGPSMNKYEYYMEYLLLKYLSSDHIDLSFLDKKEISDPVKTQHTKNSQEIFRVIWK